MEFGTFVARAADLEAETGDLATVELVTALFRDAGTALPVVARFVQGRVFPAWSERTLDVGPKACYTAIARAAGPNVSPDDVEAALADLGDIGAVAARYDFGGQQGLSSFGGDGTDALTVAAVDEELSAVAAATGEGSQEEKIARLFGLFTRCDSAEARYLARLVLGEMRIGVGEGTVRDAIAAAFDVEEDAVERALQVSNDCGMVATVARDEGRSGLADVHLEVGRPVQAMLAQAGDIEDALTAWETAAVETKFDGARVQLHYDGAEVRIFSRNTQDVTAALPEIVDHAATTLSEPAIVDGEVVAVDDAGSPRPFQEVLRRFRRKHDVAAVREEVGVELHAFDCLHAGGEDLLDAPLVDRHDRVTALLPTAATDLTLSADPDEIAELEAAAVAGGHEGIILKDPESAYTPGRRGRNWLKRKPAVDTLDLVVVGAEWGEGRRANLLGTFLLGAKDGADFVTVGKVATGLTDDQLEELTDRLEPQIRGEDGQTVDLVPRTVIEVGYEEIQSSPTYSSGYALRFPRFVTVREDKDPGDADSLDRIEGLAD